MQVEDLSELQMLPLMRAGAIPKVAMVAGCNLFQGAVGEELPGWHAQAARLALVLGGGGGDAPQGTVMASWRIADTSSAEFGSEVASNVVLDPATGVIRGAIGMAQCGSPPPRSPSGTPTNTPGRGGTRAWADHRRRCPAPRSRLPKR